MPKAPLLGREGTLALLPEETTGRTLWYKGGGLHIAFKDLPAEAALYLETQVPNSTDFVFCINSYMANNYETPLSACVFFNYVGRGYLRLCVSAAGATVWLMPYNE